MLLLLVLVLMTNRAYALVEAVGCCVCTSTVDLFDLSIFDSSCWLAPLLDLLELVLLLLLLQ